MPLEYDISDFLIFCYNFIGKKGERKKIELPRCPFEKIGFFCLEGMAAKGVVLVKFIGPPILHRGKLIFFFLHFCFYNKSKVSKNQKCHIQEAFEIDKTQCVSDKLSDKLSIFI